MTYYQLMSGDQSRDFSNVMYDFGVAIVGPGRFGSLEQNMETYNQNGEWPKVQWLKEIRLGDRIVLHSGQFIIQAIGEVTSKDGSLYHYSNCFEDIDGWDLQHHCYVEWRIVNHQLTDSYLSRSTAQRLNQQKVIDIVESLWNQSVTTPAKYLVNYP